MQHPESRDRTFICILSIFVGSITIASVLATKVINLFGLFVPAGVLAYSITFICTDVISEIWGRERANAVVWGGFASLMIVLGLVQLSLALPPAPFWQAEAAFRSILGGTSRIILASFTAYLVSQFHDVWAYHFWKQRTRGRHLWLRNNLSTIVSQLLDASVFITIAFYGQMPVVPMIVSQWLVKCAIAVLDTPVVYLLVGWLRPDRSRSADPVIAHSSTS